MDKYQYYEIFAMYDKPEEIVDVIESLRNNQLFDLTRLMGMRLNEKRGCLEAVNKEHERAQAIADVLEKKYAGAFGVKAGHIKQIIRILRNKRPEYDPNYIDKKKEDNKVN